MSCENFRCKNCKFWKRFTEKILEHEGECSNEHFVDISQSEDCPNDGLGYGDSEGYEARFRTGENFGCIHFWSREETSPARTVENGDAYR